jgi:hypothetical protein
MNAYELADRGFNSERLKYPDLWNLCIEMSKMLLQQADQIEHYKNKAEALDKRELELLAELRQNTIDLSFRAVYAEQSLKIAEKEAFKRGFRAGFMASGEGYNGELVDEVGYEADLKEAVEGFIK